MKHLFFTLAFVCCGLYVSAQICKVDSNLLNYPAEELLSPAPYTPDSPFYNYKPACIDELYDQSVTVKIPSSYSIFTIDSVRIPQLNGIKNLPMGMNYVCTPPSCTYLPNTLGCLLLTGTPSSSNNAPDTLDLLLSTTIYTLFGNFPFELPIALQPEAHVYLILNPSGNCASGTFDLASGSIGNLNIVPNPSRGAVQFLANVRESGDYQLSVIDLLGRMQWSQSVALYEGENAVSADLGVLPAGQYQVLLRNAEGGLAQRLVLE